MATPWVASAVYRKVAELCADTGDRESGRKWLARAHAVIAKEKTATSREAGTRDVMKLHIKIEEFDQAIASAHEIEGGENRRRALAQAYAAAERWNDLESIVKTATGAEEASDICWWIVCILSKW